MFARFATALALALVIAAPARALIFDDFNVDEGHFTLAPTFSGSTRNLAATSTADQTTAEQFEGAGSEQLVIETTTPDSFAQVRFLSGGGGSTTGPFGTLPNIPFTTTSGDDGWVGLALKTDVPGWTVQMWMEIGSPAGEDLTNGSVPKEVAADGQWHIYEWNLDDDTGGPDGWGPVDMIVPGSAVVMGGEHTWDSIVFRNELAPATSTIFMDFVAKSDSGSITTVLPEPGDDDADFDGDGDVDGADFVAWQRNLGAGGQTNNDLGDADANGTVEAADLEVWKTQFSAGAAGVAAIPEPALIGLLASAVLASLLLRRRA
ncbi:MAG TPA: hypothetical protein VF175_14595 [Lacipirellula sp.]